MSREIKFRFWDKHNKQWAWFNTMRGELFPDRENNPSIWSFESQDFFIPCQYTGLKDATKWEVLTEEERAEWTQNGNMPSEWKGKEIYEGDVVHKKDPEYWGAGLSINSDLFRGGIGQVVSKPFGWRIEEIDCGEWCFNGPEGPEFLSFDLEIIGNIYENSELLDE